MPAALISREEVRKDKIIKADETPHKMLENKKRKESWYLWGFSIEKSCTIGNKKMVLTLNPT